MSETARVQSRPPRPLETMTVIGSFVRVSHTLFSLPLVLAGMWIGADGAPAWRVFALALLAATGARTAAMALNRIIDRRIDAANERTAMRELPRGALRLRQAWLVVALGTALYFLGAGALGRLTLWLSPIPLVVFAGYPFLKRFTALCHFGVGLALGLAPLGGWVAVTQSFAGLLDVLPLGVFGLLWVAGFDVIYATLDEAFDRAHGIHSLPARLGRRGALAVSGALHLLAFGALVWLWIEHGWTTAALVPLGAAGLLLFFEHRLSDRVNLAFFRINIVVGFSVLVFVLAGVLSGCTRPELPGRALFHAGFCPQCHGDNRQGTKQGPPLKQLKRYWTEDQLVVYLTDPPTTIATNERLRILTHLYPAIMPTFKMDEGNRRELAHYLLMAEE